jgi:hypothetical protein
MFVAIFECELGDAGFVELAEAFVDHVVVLFFCGARQRLIETEIARELMPKSLATFISAQSAQVELAKEFSMSVLPPALALRDRTNIPSPNPAKTKPTFRHQRPPATSASASAESLDLLCSCLL